MVIESAQQDRSPFLRTRMIPSHPQTTKTPPPPYSHLTPHFHHLKILNQPSTRNMAVHSRLSVHRQPPDRFQDLPEEVRYNIHELLTTTSSHRLVLPFTGGCVASTFTYTLAPPPPDLQAHILRILIHSSSPPLAGQHPAHGP